MKRYNGQASWYLFGCVLVIVLFLLVLANMGCATSTDSMSGKCECICQCGEDVVCRAECGGDTEGETRDPPTLPIGG